jgi:uncharacterized membrane protein YesL
MLDGLRVLRRSWRPFYQEMFYLSIANLLWAVLAFFIIPIPAATALVFYVANRVAHDEAVGWAEAWTAVRTHLGLIYLFGVANALVYIVLLYDVWFYAPAPGTVGAIMRAVPVALLAFWTPIQLNLLPVLFESQEKRFWPVLRDAALLVLDNPGYYLAIYLFLLIPIIISSILIFPWAIVTLGYIAVVLNASLLDRRGFYTEMDRRQAALERKRRMQGDNNP